MELQLGPNSQDEPSVLFKLQHKVKIFNTAESLPNRGYNLITSSTKYGIVFAASPDSTLSTYYLKELINKESVGKHLTTKLSGKPTHLAVNCDQELLAVTDGKLLTIYKVSDFNNVNVSPSMNIRCDVNPSTFVSALQWNPCIPDSIAIAYYDGTLLASQVSTGQIKKISSKARCICWSPKGKQLVTGNSDGTLTQYKPDLSPAKTMPAPNLYESAPVEALAIYWISTFQFAVVFKNATDNSRPAVTIVNTPKAGQPSCVNFHDICYSIGTNRPWYYYLYGLPQWNMILCSSSNSMELATLGSSDGSNWLQWCQSDEGRPDLPLTDQRIENYPVGICIDTCAVHQLNWGENQTLPHMPILLVVSQTGLLTIFNIINLKNDAPQLCTPPQALTLPENAMISEIPGEAPPASVPQPQPQQQQTQPPAYLSQIQQPPQQVPQPTQAAFTPAPAQTASSQFAAMGFSNQTLKPAQPVISQAQQAPSLVKSMVTPQPQVTQVAQKPSPLAQVKPQSPLSQENAALKEEQEKITKMKANQELKNMLLREVREFQLDTYKFAVKTRQSQIKIQKDINAMTTNFDLHSLDIENLRRECTVEQLRASIVQLKLELVRTCAVVAETTTHAQMKDVQEWTHADPLTTKRIASIKKLEYYIQTQLEQAQQALDHKWSNMLQRNPQYKQGRMIRPILDDIYQPLVKQQEILSRQSAVLRTLKNTLNECNSSPIVKSTALLRSTPFRNRDPLAKLTKNILNMSIESRDTNRADSAFTAQKLDALRDMLANNKVVKIKPVNIEMTEHMKAVRLSYEKSLKEQIKCMEQDVKPQSALTQSSGHKNEFNKSVPQVIPTSPFGNQKASALANVARTLFTDNDEQEPTKPSQQSMFTSAKAFASQPESQKPSLMLASKTTQLTKPIPSFSVKANETAQPVLTFGQKSEGQKPTLAFGSPTSVAQKPAMAFGAPASVTQKPAMAFGAPASDPQKPAMAFGDPASVIQKPPMALGAPASDPQKPAMAFGDPASVTQKPPMALGAPASDPQKPVLAFGTSTTVSQKPAVTFSAPASDAQKPVIAFGVATTVAQKPTLAISAPSSEAQKPAMSFGSPASEEKNQESTATRSRILTNLLNKNDENTFMGQKICSPNSFNFSATATSTSTPLITAKPIAEISNMFSKFQTIEPSDKAKSDETGEDEASSSTEQKASAKSLPSIVPDVLKSTQDIKPEVEKSEIKEDVSDKNKVVLKPSVKENTPKEEDIIKTPVAPPSQDNSSVGAENTETNDAAKSNASPSASSIFAAAASKPSSIFGGASPSKSIFGDTNQVNTMSKPLFGSPTSSGGSIFATTSASSAFSKSIFGVKTTTSAELTPTQSTIKDTSEVSAVAPSTEVKALFGAEPGSPKPIEEAKLSSPVTEPLTPPVETKPTVFSTPTPASPSSVFGSQSPKPASVFGSSAASLFASANTQASIFGSSPPTTTQSSASIAPSPTLGSTTDKSTFGTAISTTQASVFGSTSPTSVFGAAVTTTQSIFGATPSPSIFGTAQGSVFSASPGKSVFGAATSQTATTQSSLFGTPTTQASIFGQTAPSSSIFGSQATTTASSVSIFGATDNLFASASISTTSAPSQTGGSIFGGGNTNVFGGKTTFGAANPSTAAIFGGGASFGQQPAENNSFWGKGTNNGGGFGSSGFATTQSTSVFGGGSGGSFSSPSPSGGAFSSPTPQGSVFGSPQQNSPGFGGSSGFGSKATFGQPSGFGSPPAAGFGSSATFGGFSKSPSSGFGASASFGGGATFGGSAFGSTSPSKVFGGGSPSAGFGSTQSNTTFENLATQNTMTFGNLAQQSAPAQPPAFNASPSFTGWRG